MKRLCTTGQPRSTVLAEAEHGAKAFDQSMQRIPFQILQDEYIRVLLKTGFAPERAVLVARRFTENQRDGVYSHGLHRFPSFFASIRANGIIQPIIATTPAREDELPRDARFQTICAS